MVQITLLMQGAGAAGYFNTLYNHVQTNFGGAGVMTNPAAAINHLSNLAAGYGTKVVATNGYECKWPFIHDGVTYYQGRCPSEGLNTPGAGWCATDTYRGGEYRYWGFCPGTYTVMGDRCKFPFYAVENHEIKLFTNTCAPKKDMKDVTWCPTVNGGWGDCNRQGVKKEEEKKIVENPYVAVFVPETEANKAFNLASPATDKPNLELNLSFRLKGSGQADIAKKIVIALNKKSSEINYGDAKIKVDGADVVLASSPAFTMSDDHSQITLTLKEEQVLGNKLITVSGLLKMGTDKSVLHVQRRIERIEILGPQATDNVNPLFQNTDVEPVLMSYFAQPCVDFTSLIDNGKAVCQCETLKDTSKHVSHNLTLRNKCGDRYQAKPAYQKKGDGNPITVALDTTDTDKFKSVTVKINQPVVVVVTIPTTKVRLCVPSASYRSGTKMYPNLLNIAREDATVKASGKDVKVTRFFIHGDLKQDDAGPSSSNGDIKFECDTPQLIAATEIATVDVYTMGNLATASYHTERGFQAS